MGNTTGTIAKKWDETDWLRMFAIGLPLIEGGMTRARAFQQAQAAVIVDPAKLKGGPSLVMSFAPSNPKGVAMLAKWQALTEVQRQAVRDSIGRPPAKAPAPAAAPATDPAPSSKVTRAAAIKWTQRERVIMAREVERIAATYPGEGLAAMYAVAQADVLSIDRHMSGQRIAGAFRSGELAKQHAQALADAWQYPEQPKPAGSMSTPAPATIAAPAPVQAPASAPTSHVMVAAAQAFGAAMTAALGDLLAVQERQFSERMREAAERSAARLPDIVGPVLQQLLRVQLDHIAHASADALRGVLLQELGGGTVAQAPAAPATPKAPEAPASAHGGADEPTPPAVKVQRFDVIGELSSEWITKAHEAAAPHTLTVVHPRDLGQYAPHKGHHVILMQQKFKLPRSLQSKLATVKVTPMTVRDAGGHVVRAIQELTGQRLNGATLQ